MGRKKGKSEKTKEKEQEKRKEQEKEEKLFMLNQRKIELVLNIMKIEKKDNFIDMREELKNIKKEIDLLK